MRTATGLTLVALGAILALAVTAQPSFLNLHVAGFVIALTGLAGLVVPRRGYSWLLRRVVVKRGPRGRVKRVEDRSYPPYLTLNPAASDTEPAGPQPGQMTGAMRIMPGQAIGQDMVTDETVDEFIEE